jgi:P-type E1-E2 ATPase
MQDTSVSVAAAQAYASFYLLNNSFIPLDLVVMIDMAKILYTIYLESDVSVYGLQVKNMSLHEDLTSIDYLFCDKTGTLTQNELRFRGLCLRGSQIVGSPRSECLKGSDAEMLTRVICVCHDVMRIQSEQGSNFLTGSSQDELNLMQMCEDEGLGSFMQKDSDSFTIEVAG